MTKQKRSFPPRASTILQSQRDQLDLINSQVVDLLSARMRVCMDIAELKAEYGIPMMQPQRISQILGHLKKKSVEVGLNAAYVESIFKLIIEETCVQEARLISQRLNQGEES